MTTWWGNGCSPCPEVKVKVRHEQKFKCCGTFSSAGGVCFGLPLGAGLYCLLFKWPVLVTPGVLQHIGSDQSLSCHSHAQAAPVCLFSFLGGGIDLQLYCKPLFNLDWHMCNYVMSRLKTLCMIFVCVIFHWDSLAGFIFRSLFSSWLLWSEEH